MKKVSVLLIIFASVLFLSGCANSSSSQVNLTPEGKEHAPGSAASEERPAQPGPEPSETPDRLDLRPTQTPPIGLDREETPESAPMMGEVPTEILEEIFADLTKRTDADRDDIKVIRAEAVVWNDGSLGCPKPGEFYIQILVSGYWVVFQVEGVEYDYRVSDSGHFNLCEGNSMPPINSPDTGEPGTLTEAKDTRPQKGTTQEPTIDLPGSDSDLPQLPAPTAGSIVITNTTATPVSPESSASGLTPTPALQELFEKAKVDLADRLKISVDQIDLLKVVQAKWPYDSIGCPLPKGVSIDTSTPGYQILLEVNGQVYTYHTDGKDWVVSCVVKPPNEIRTLP